MWHIVFSFNKSQLSFPDPQAKESRLYVCGKKFLTKAHMRRHMALHTGEKQFSCPRCEYKCNVKSNLKKHCLSSHGLDYPPKVRHSIVGNRFNKTKLKEETKDVVLEVAVQPNWDWANITL